MPAALFASAGEDAPDAGASLGAAGVACIVVALWSLGSPLAQGWKHCVCVYVCVRS